MIFANGNFWGRTIAACGSSDDPDRFRRFGPFGGLEFHLVDYNDLNALEKELKHPHTAAFMVEPIQGEAGIYIPDEGYLKGVRELCTKHNVLMIADEVQTGIGRTGRLLASEWENVRPDMVCLGKSLGGGFMPVSAVLADDEVMLNIKAGEHGSTFGGNPLACRIGMKCLELLEKENMVENSAKMGKYMLRKMREMTADKDFVAEVRGRGLFTAIEIHNTADITAMEITLRLMDLGLLAKPTHENIIR